LQCQHNRRELPCCPWRHGADQKPMSYFQFYSVLPHAEQTIDMNIPLRFLRRLSSCLLNIFLPHSHLRTIMADLHIACRAHAAPMSFPCHAVTLRVFRMCLSHLIYTVRPCLIHNCHAMPTPRPCHALTMPFFSRPRHSTAVEKRPVDYLPAFGFFRLPRGVPRRLLSEAYLSSLQ